MKNNECTISIILPSEWKQVYRKVDGQWTQTTNGVVRKMTAEQLLSHILPLLIKGQKRAKLQVVKKKCGARRCGGSHH
jgi:hypothetical protein